MTTSASLSLLSEPRGEDRLSQRSLGYVTGMSRLQFHQAVLDAFEESGITRATLAKRLGKRPEQISRLLGAPGNWTIDTAAELLFAIDGSLARIERYRPSTSARNYYTGSGLSSGSRVIPVVSEVTPYSTANTSTVVGDR